MRRELTVDRSWEPDRPGAGRRLLVAAVLTVVGLTGTACSKGGSQGVPSGEAGKAAVGTDGATGSTEGGSSPRSRRTTTLHPLPSEVADDIQLPVRVESVSKVAQAVGERIEVYRARGDATSWMTLKQSSAKAPRVFLVQDQEEGWIRVVLPVRPNGAQGWVKAEDVKLFRHDYRIQVSVSKHTLTVFRGSTVLLEERAGLGTATTPTPGGVFYTMELLKPPNPTGAYGPYAYGLSGHSKVINEFLGGDGRLGIHGTNDPSGLGRSVSHGCIRISNVGIEKMAKMLPLGVPVMIVA